MVAYCYVRFDDASAWSLRYRRRAALPNIVDEDDLITANAIDSASWSTALCVGAMLGGIVVSIWGTDLAFIIDSYTFFCHHYC